MRTDSGPGPVGPPAPASGPPPARPLRRLYRDPNNKIIAGVAAGLAEHLGVRAVVVRVVFISLLAANGLGALLYAAFWAVLPTLPTPPGTPRRRVNRLQRFGLFALAVGVIIFSAELGGFGQDVSLIVLLAVVAFGAGTIWHQADPQRRRSRAAPAATGAWPPVDLVSAQPSGLASALVPVAGAATTSPPTGVSPGPPDVPLAGSPDLGPEARTAGAPELIGVPVRETDAARVAIAAAAARRAEVETIGDRRWVPIRIIGGGLLVVVGIVGILGFFAPKGSDGFGAILTGLLFGLLALAGLVLALAPLIYRVFGQLREERVARIREQERAEVAAVVHDQVLHTLALIQRNAGDTTSVVRLARGQERTLRSWLYKPAGSPTELFAAALEQAAAEVEDTYAISVETVIVGDAANDERVSALVAATREALVNAARHGKVGTVSLYAEAEEDKLTVFVRDRGAGFDLSSVDQDRHGVRGSIIGRMSRHGGQAEVRSSPGEGTEVALTLPRSGKESQL